MTKMIYLIYSLENGFVAAAHDMETAKELILQDASDNGMPINKFEKLKQKLKETDKIYTYNTAGYEVIETFLY